MAAHASARDRRELALRRQALIRSSQRHRDELSAGIRLVAAPLAWVPVVLGMARSRRRLPWLPLIALGALAASGRLPWLARAAMLALSVVTRRPGRTDVAPY